MYIIPARTRLNYVHSNADGFLYHGMPLGLKWEDLDGSRIRVQRSLVHPSNGQGFSKTLRPTVHAGRLQSLPRFSKRSRSTAVSRYEIAWLVSAGWAHVVPGVYYDAIISRLNVKVGFAM